MLDQQQVSVGVAQVSNILFAKVTVSDETDQATVIIADGHTNVVSIDVNGDAVFIIDPQPKQASKHQPENIFSDASAHDIYEFALNVPIEDIQFITESLE